MMFNDIFKIDEANNRPVAKQMLDFEIVSGRYNGGLISILDTDLSDSALMGWRWLLGQDAVALAATSIGDLFFWSEKHSAVYFLEIQRGQSTFVDKEVEYFLNDFLVKDGVQDKVLHRDLCQSLNARLGRLSYGDCFIAEPWLMLGGSGDENTYTLGNLAVYLNLAGQAVEQKMSIARQA